MFDEHMFLFSVQKIEISYKEKIDILDKIQSNMSIS